MINISPYSHRKYGTDKPTYDEAEQIAIESIGRASQVLPPHKQAVNMQDLFFVLQVPLFLPQLYQGCAPRVLEPRFFKY